MAVIRPTGYLSHYGFSPEETEEYLEHYGVKGMKWGKHLKAKISDLSDKYITGKSAKEAHEKETANAEKNWLNETRASLERQKHNSDAVEAKKDSDRDSELAAASYAKAKEYRGKAFKLGYDSNYYKYRMNQSNVPMLDRLDAASKYYGSVNEGSRLEGYAKRYNLTGDKLSERASETRKSIGPSKAAAQVAAQKQQGYSNAKNAARAKAASAKRSYDKSLAGRIEKGKKKAKDLLSKAKKK